MKLLTFSISLLTLLASTAAQQVNRTQSNGWGSTPADRHYINHEQALKVIDAAVQKSHEIK